MYFLKRLGRQELGSITIPGDRPSRGRYIYISKSEEVLSFFPPLSKTVLNDSSLLPIIPLYSETPEKVYVNFIYHNDKHNGNNAATRDEYRIYLNSALEMEQLYFVENDILIMKKASISTKADEGNVTNQTVYFTDKVSPSNTSLYQTCAEIIDHASNRGGHAITTTEIPTFEEKIDTFFSSAEPLETVVDTSVTRRIETSSTNFEDLFNSASFRDFTMTAYENKCAVTGSVISYNNFMNLEAAHIQPKSHGGPFLPSNGLALSRDIHWSFDKGFFTLNDDYTIRVHERIQSDFLTFYNGKSIHIPDNDFFKPNIEYINHHRDNVFGLFLTSGRL